ncbi:TM2 domain-containing protein [Actinomyces minihominis]|uniref:TM2 domain-containing protein n=1 Tax=Actinomyces minihominis TaxID=2002838 RepID=UPI000C079DC5|nr:TM2 domain-containing protein [Actinomyces minihominis]
MSEDKNRDQSPAVQQTVAKENIYFTPEATPQNAPYEQSVPSESNPYAQTYPTSGGYGQPYATPTFEQFTVEEVPWSSKNKLAAGLFGILLGALGVHNFYLGYTGKGVAQLLITILSFGILSWVSGIWGLVEGILILASEVGAKWDLDALGRPMRPVGQTGF